FFSVFTFKLKEGNPAAALLEPQTLVLSQTTARKYFGNGPALGKTLIVGNFNSAYRVTGVMEDMPHNAHFHFDMLLSMASFASSRGTEWVSNNFYTYAVLREGTPVSTFAGKMPGLVQRYVAPQLAQAFQYPFEQFQKNGGKWAFFTQPMGDIHLYSDFPEGEIEPNGSITYVYIFSAIAGFILLIACINFMNLATARSANRAKEVGIRKVLGSVKSRLVGQFLTESLIYSLVAVALAYALTSLCLQPFNAIAGKNLSAGVLLSGWLLGGIVVLTLGVGILAGSYPAFYLTSFRPVEVLKGRLKAGARSSHIRNALVVSQFAISICLIICTWVVYGQLEYTRNKNLGLDKENVLVVTNARRLGTNLQAFKQTLARQAQVANVTVAGQLPADNESNNTVFRKEGSTEDNVFGFFRADEDYFTTLKMKLVQGRGFSRQFGTDTAAIVINEAAAKQLGWAEPLGRKLLFYGEGPDRVRPLTVIGVVKDFNFESLRNKIAPIIIMYARGPESYAAVRLKPGSAEAGVALAEKIWKQHAPAEPFEYAFLDQNFDALFRAEQRLGKVFAIFTGLGIFIACLGLFGLSAFVAEQRGKEIGVRKVLGASVPQIVLLLSGDFTRLVLIAFGVAAPLAWYAMHRWLENFAYRAPISPLTFVLAGVAALFIAWITLSFQAVKAAVTDPVKTLRSE
ncbi:MAG TPA: ABC transporter permease, partial [Cytophagales bacterium]